MPGFNGKRPTIKHLFPHSSHNLLVNVEVGHFLSIAWITHCFLRVPRSPRIPWLSLPRRTMASQCSCQEIVYSLLMENIFASSRCLSQSELDPHHDCKWKGASSSRCSCTTRVLGFLPDGGAWCDTRTRQRIPTYSVILQTYCICTHFYLSVLLQI